jgi:hypothetical protein
MWESRIDLPDGPVGPVAATLRRHVVSLEKQIVAYF